MSKPRRHGRGWRIRWNDENGVRHSKTFCTEEEAALELQRQKLAVRERKLGLRPPERQSRCFNDAADYWMSSRAPKKRSFKDDESMLRRHLRPHFGRLPLGDIGAWVVAVDRYKALKSRLSDKTVHNHLTLLGSVLRVAHDLGWMDRVPPIKKPSVKLDQSSYRYLRNDDEVRRFLLAAEAEGEMVHMLYTTALYTGLRAGELAGLEWGDIDWDTRLITVSRSFDGPTKSNRVRYVPILDVLLPHCWRSRETVVSVTIRRADALSRRGSRSVPVRGPQGEWESSPAQA